MSLLMKRIILLPLLSSALSQFKSASGFSTCYKELLIPTLKGISLHDITKDIRDFVKTSLIKEGVVTVLSRHTTCGVTINEMEGRLVDDLRQYLLKLAPPDYPYLHNDLHLRKGPAGWPGGDEAWRAQEPVNAHSHLISMIMGASESVPVHEGDLMIGKWQSVILVEDFENLAEWESDCLVRIKSKKPMIVARCNISA
eukprot:gene10160-21178_t